MSASTAEPWEDQALCQIAEPTLFYPEGNIGTAARAAYELAKRWCARCPVRENCLKAAMDREGSASAKERHGVWGGLDPTERADLRKRESRARAEECAA